MHLKIGRVGEVKGFKMPEFFKYGIHYHEVSRKKKEEWNVLVLIKIVEKKNAC